MKLYSQISPLLILYFSVDFELVSNLELAHWMKTTVTLQARSTTEHAELFSICIIQVMSVERSLVLWSAA
jgi:hypothetical protein